MSLLLRGLGRLVMSGNPGRFCQSQMMPTTFQLSLSTDVKVATKEEIDKLVKKPSVVVFMKGVPTEPKCGFSNAVVQILRMHGVGSYDAHDVLKDESLRQGIKDYSNWPTIPQIYINGEFVGGCDIVIEMHKNGELIQELEKVGIKSALIEDEPKKTE